MSIALGAILRFGFELLNKSLKVPVWVFLALIVAGWLGSIVVAHNARKDFVDIAELKAAQSKNEGLRLILEYERLRRANETAANEQFEQDLALAERDKENLENEIEKLRQSSLAGDDEPIGDALLKQLRNP